MQENKLNNQQDGKVDMNSKIDAYTPSYSLWTGLIFLFVCYGGELDRIFNLYILLLPIIGLPIIIWAIIMIVFLIRNAYRRNWRRVVSIIAAPFIAATILWMLGQLGLKQELIYLEYRKPCYLIDIAAQPNENGKMHFKSWDWGVTGGATCTDIYYILVYDESDQIGLPPPDGSDYSQKLINSGDQYLREKFFKVYPQGYTPGLYNNLNPIIIKHLEGHFYLVEILQE